MGRRREVERKRREGSGGKRRKGAATEVESRRVKERKRAGDLSLCNSAISERGEDSTHALFPPAAPRKQAERQERSDWQDKHRLSEPQRGGRRSEV